MVAILVIDDEEAVLHMVKTMLESIGHVVSVARDGQTATAALQQEPIDVVIADIFMPNQEGVDMIMHLTRHHPAMAVIAMSGSFGDDAMAGAARTFDRLSIARELGVAAVLRKPFRKQELLDLVAAVLRQATANPSHLGRATTSSV